MFRTIACALAIAGVSGASIAAPSAALAAPATDHSMRDDGRPDEGDSWKYFHFHKAGVSEAEARADVIECHGYAQNLVLLRQGSTATYSSVPYTAGLNVAQAAAAGAIGGLIGGVIAGFANAGERRAMERINLRKCFAFKGYDRYEMSKDAHRALFDGPGEEVRARIVALVSGPAPAGERLVR